MVAYVFSKRLFDRYMSEHGITDGNIPEGMAVVSIGEPSESESDHWFQEPSCSVLNIDFWDVNGYRVEDVLGMTDEQAFEIYRFLSGNIGKDFYIHCRAGVSRSQAVARFLEDCYGYEVVQGSDRPPFPNAHVLALLKREYAKDAFGDGIQFSRC